MKERWSSDQLRELREAAGLTQGDVARRLGVTAGRIHNLETARTITQRAAERLSVAIVELAAERAAGDDGWAERTATDVRRAELAGDVR